MSAEALNTSSGPLTGLVERTLESAIADFIPRYQERDNPAYRRVEAAIKNAFLPYIQEADLIGRGLNSPEYSAFMEDVQAYLGPGKIGGVRCPDGRIAGVALGDPRVMSIYGSLRGMPQVRWSTKDSKNSTPVDTDLKAAINNAFKTQQLEWLVELVGPHIYSTHPHHGCGAAGARLGQQGLPVNAQTMWDGGIRAYFKEAEERKVYSAFNNVAARAGGKGYTWDIVHDIHSQGLILGLKRYNYILQGGESLRENLERMVTEGDIVMTEQMAEVMRDEIDTIAQSIDPTYRPDSPVDTRDPKTFVKNAMLIGRTALELAQKYEAANFPFIPEKYKDAVDPVYVKVLAYHLLRNAVYQVVGEIIPGDHSLLHHPERLLRVGPIGADFNVGTIPFVVGTPQLLSETDVDNVLALYDLMGTFLPKQGVDLTTEARVITVTAAFNPDMYKDETYAKQEFTKTVTILRESAARIRERLPLALQEGHVVIIPVVHHATTREVFSTL